MDVSIILVSFNTKDLTRDCLKSIFEKTSGLEFEIIVVDNDSSDDSVRVIKEEFPHVKVIKNQENLGFGRANNIGAEIASGKYFFFLNTDTLLVNNAVKILFDFLESPNNGLIGCTGGILLNEDLSYQASYSQFRGWSDILGIKKIKAILNWGGKVVKDPLQVILEKNENTVFPVDYVAGADMFFRAELFKHLKGFDQALFLYFEEAVLSYQMKKEGFSSILKTDARIIHLGGKSTDLPSLKKVKIFEKSKFYYYKKCKGWFVYFIAKYLQVIQYLILFILKLLTFRVDTYRLELIKITIKS